MKFLQRGTAKVINEFPDLDLAVRALASGCPPQPALAKVSWDRFKAAMMETLHPLYQDGVDLRSISQFDQITSEVPPR